MYQGTAADRAYELITHKILFLELPPGSVINEAELMEELQFGRSPIRHALHRLEQENLVVILPRQGTLVSQISLDDFQEVFELRMDLEGLAAYLAAKRAKPEHLEALEHLLQEAEQYAQKGNDKIDVEIDGKFHQIIAEAAANKYLKKTLNELFHQSVRLFNFSRTRSASIEEEIPNYQAIYECFKNKDADGAQAWMQEHIRASMERVGASFSLRPVWE